MFGFKFNMPVKVQVEMCRGSCTGDWYLKPQGSEEVTIGAEVQMLSLAL